ncbi:hypothetical protein C8F01DRAFT_309612 [Mycena amicta]|nr:hypothetical protein C8F01DRAFT_309612 [Mycena amicta]
MLVHKKPPTKPFFKRHHTEPDALRAPPQVPSRSPSPAASIYREGLRPSTDEHLSPRAVSPAGSFYSQSSSSSPSVQIPASPIRPLPSPPALVIATNWLSRSPKSASSIDLMSRRSNSSDLSPPETPLDVPDTELRRRQLSKAARVLGENVPLELVFQPKPKQTTLLRAFPEPPPRRSTESPLPGQLPREVLTERSLTLNARRPAKIARRASLSLATFASKFRGGSNTHSRASSQESQAQSTVSTSSSGSSPSSADDRSPTARDRTSLTSPILFAFPKRIHSQPRRRPRSPTWPRAPPSPAPTLEFDPVGHGSMEFDPDLIIDIRPSPDLDLDDDEDGDSDLETPVVEFPTPRTSRRLHGYSSSEVLRPTPRIVPMPSHGHSGSEIVSPSTRRPTTPFNRPETPFADYSRPQTPFVDYVRSQTPFEDRAPARPTTPFVDYRPGTPFTDHDLIEPETIANHFLSPVVSRRRDQGWSGEWNQRDMSEVIQKLRALK